MTIEQIQATLANLMNELRGMDKLLEDENRLATVEEKRVREDKEKQIDELEEELKHKIKMLEREKSLADMRVPPIEVAATPVVDLSRPAHKPVVTGGESVASKSNFGCDNLGQFLQVVIKGAADPRYSMIVNATKSRFGNTMSLGTEGLIIPDTWSASLLAPALTNPNSLLSKATFIPIARGDFKQPYSADTASGAGDDWQDVPEGSTATDTDSTPAMLKIDLGKIQKKVSLTDELMEDFGPQMEEFIQRKVAAGFITAVNRRIVNGSGVSSFTGLLSGATAGAVEVTRDTANSIIVEDIFAMEARMPQEWYNDPSTVWIANPDCKPLLRVLKIEGTAGGVYPAYLPAGGASAAGFDALMGKPIFWIDTPSTVGTRGDFMLVKMNDYFVAARSSSYTSKIDLSVLFNNDKAQFKFTWRAGGKLGLQAAVARENGGSNTFSTCVTLSTKTS